MVSLVGAGTGTSFALARFFDSAGREGGLDFFEKIFPWVGPEMGWLVTPQVTLGSKIFHHPSLGCAYREQMSSHG